MCRQKEAAFKDREKRKRHQEKRLHQPEECHRPQEELLNILTRTYKSYQGDTLRAGLKGRSLLVYSSRKVIGQINNGPTSSP